MGKEKKVFGVALANEVPPFLQRILKHLDKHAMDVEGIFRIQPSEKIINPLIKKIDQGKKVEIEKQDIHIVATFLKRFIRELPEPLLTYEFYDMFLATAAINDDSAKELQIKKVIQYIPSVNYDVLRTLCAFFYRLQMNSEVNKMTPRNISICFAQNVLRPEPMGRNAMEEMNMVLEDQPYSQTLLEFIIGHYVQLFDDSGILVSSSKQEKMEAALSSWLGAAEEQEEAENEKGKGKGKGKGKEKDKKKLFKKNYTTVSPTPESRPMSESPASLQPGTTSNARPKSAQFSSPPLLTPQPPSGPAEPQSSQQQSGGAAGYLATLPPPPPPNEGGEVVRKGTVSGLPPPPPPLARSVPDS